MKNKLRVFNVDSIDLREKTLLDFLKAKGEYSGRLVKRAHKDGNIEVNGTKKRLDYKIKLGDKVTLIIEEDNDISNDILPQDISLRVVYEDEELLVIDKPPLLLVHPTPNHPEGTLANGVAFHFQKQNINAPVRLVSRLDRDTSGLVLIAKSSIAHSKLAGQMEKKEVRKKYLAIVEGIPQMVKGTIDVPIGKDDRDQILRVVRPDGLPSITEYSIKETFGEYSLLELELKTGRTHQIRVHLQYIGHPILGDSLYGRRSHLISRQALHAHRLSLRHPLTEELIELESPLPEDMKMLVVK